MEASATYLKAIPTIKHLVAPPLYQFLIKLNIKLMMQKILVDRKFLNNVELPKNYFSFLKNSFIFLLSELNFISDPNFRKIENKNSKILKSTPDPL